MNTASRQNLFSLDRQRLEAFFQALGEKPFRASQVLKWIHQQGITDFEQMSNISKNLRQRLAAKTDLITPQEITHHYSEDGTRKWVLQVDSGNAIETVFIPEEGRNTLCISSQVGCALNCSFCATAQQGFNRNLSVAEIIGQLWLAEHSLRPELDIKPGQRVISNVVLMGMGEPLLNFDAVVAAMRLMMDDFAYGLSWRRITLSTAGVIPALDRLKEQCPVNLAVSLHAPDDKLRDQLVPLNQKYPIHDLIEACQRYLEGENRKRITFEYVLLKGVNDSTAQARALVNLLRDVPAKVNLIPFNPFPESKYQRSSQQTVDRFREVLMSANLITVTRKTRGDDIAAACGQLAGKVQDRSRRQTPVIQPSDLTT
ncbi:23S rRNA (adenine(2503)-C(2))-methyltransferase RlmN [Candidatus Venteria ishoeyi]|uniref:Dual-specificity RNA methyltransferase RlmN n=1 Tax=Candidatus Venteria ishoeyi TaxID=1899563 RepID=A0A1H6FFU7_9GAMM|nr:23S rRNA (adenine(2503)-C(2))-methyltransferase RlmN [Candidatus Venteria ishoeyi]MDM8544891.1 23S rRNA (adenine(2503)-C(2))-methyltransferase RlmN [Candidatus Venteria ishoeyi]SEH08523.1 Dual-specificity RNA methyltransferase RlmN [Candidatus Venteria ishoeyi]